MGADIGERFNTALAVYAAVVASAVVAFLFLLWNLAAAPWRLHDEQAVRVREFERRPDVGRLVELRGQGVQLLNRPVQSEHELPALWATLREWEGHTAAELEKCATGGDVSSFRVLGAVLAKALPVFPTKYTLHDREVAMLSEQLDRLLAIIGRIEGGAR